MTADSVYQPLRPARRPGGKPGSAPRYRVLVHRKFYQHWTQMVTMVGLASAQELWDHLATKAGSVPLTKGSCFLRGSAGRPKGDGWSRTIHYELSSKARVDYQFHDRYTDGALGDEHSVVAILAIDYSSH